MQLTSLQNLCVNKLLALYNAGKKQVEFKAPTGSGKTLMATQFIAKVLQENAEEKIIFIIATLSTSALPSAFEHKINEYKNDLDFKDFEAEYYPSPSASKVKLKDYQPQIALERNRVYIFGKASFGKDRIFTQQNTISDLIDEAKEQNYKILYIRDEAHIGDKKDQGSRNFEALMSENADFILKMTASFNRHEGNRVELTEKDLNNEDRNDNKWLLKQECIRLSDTTISDEELMDKAIDEFIQIKREYKKLRSDGVFINPALLVQVDNKPKEAEAENTYTQTLKTLTEKLSSRGLSWIIYFGDQKDFSHVDNKDLSLHKISQNDDNTDCIIFKIGPATGWDIPRACMLLRLRNVCSSALHIQTLGRIKRNPYPQLAKNAITDKYYLFENDKGEKDYTDYVYSLKEDFREIQMPKITVKLSQGGFKTDKALEASQIHTFVSKQQEEIKRKLDTCFTDNQCTIQEKKIKIQNPITLLKRIEVLQNAMGNKAYLNVLDNVTQCLLNEPTLKDFKPMQIKLVLLEYYSGAIKTLYQASLANTEFFYQHHLETINPTEYTEQRQSAMDNNNDNRIYTKNYLFTIKRNGLESQRIPLDSEPEKVVFSILQEFINNNSDTELWCKNQSSGNIYIEYFDSDFHKRKNYADFVVKFANGFYLYIEVKRMGSDDIDKKKTENLKKAYKEYFKSRTQKGIFDALGGDIVLCLVNVKVDTNGGNIGDIIPFYDTSNKGLEALKNAGTDLKNILEIVKKI